MNTIDKLRAISELKCIYAILFRTAGVGFQFYTGTEEQCVHDRDWQRYLKVEKYYPTFEDAVEAEFDQLPGEIERLVEDCRNWSQINLAHGKHCWNCSNRNGYPFRGQPDSNCDHFEGRGK